MKAAKSFYWAKFKVLSSRPNPPLIFSSWPISLQVSFPPISHFDPIFSHSNSDNCSLPQLFVMGIAIPIDSFRKIPIVSLKPLPKQLKFEPKRIHELLYKSWKLQSPYPLLHRVQRQTMDLDPDLSRVEITFMHRLLWLHSLMINK